jgi:predicted phage tail protein
MHNQAPSIVGEIIFGVVTVTLGASLMFFADHYFDWTIKRLQSKAFRAFYRFLGAFIALGGVVFLGTTFWPR